LKEKEWKKLQTRTQSLGLNRSGKHHDHLHHPKWHLNLKFRLNLKDVNLDALKAQWFAAAARALKLQLLSSLHVTSEPLGFRGESERTICNVTSSD
jgi:hypothetical protein